jgi:phage tail-like protein
MIANGQQGYFFLNDANRWSSFVFSKATVDSRGAIGLAKIATGFEPAGVFMGGPFEVTPAIASWFRFGADADPLPPASHVQFFTFTADAGAPAFAPLTDTPFPGWSPIPRDSFDAVIPNATGRKFWIGAVIRGDGAATPSIRQIRVDYGRDTYLKYLPAIYRRDASSRDMLERFLSLSQTGLGRVHQETADLPLLFDPYATPASGFPSWLGWLSGWLAWQMNQAWTEPQARKYIAGAYALYGQRGTVHGLKRYLKIYAGVNAHILEPARMATLWSLGQNSTLGFSTMLAPGEAQGAVLGSTAILDRSSLPDPTAGFGSVLFSDIAHRFCVLIYCADLTRPGALKDARAVIDREKPAHTVYELCLIGAAMRVGSQSTVGVDAIVGGGREQHIGKRLGGTLAAKDRECSEKEVV